jgi:hypothetical protein
LEFKKAFDYIVGKVEEELVKQNYTKQKVVAENDNELVSLFTSASLAYSVVYYKDKEQMVLRSCTMTDEGPDNEWKTLATWLYDETVGTQKDADSMTLSKAFRVHLQSKGQSRLSRKRKRMTTEPPIRSFSQSVL